MNTAQQQTESREQLQLALAQAGQLLAHLADQKAAAVVALDTIRRRRVAIADRLAHLARQARAAVRA